jgi:hypothetical protein
MGDLGLLFLTLPLHKLLLMIFPIKTQENFLKLASVEIFLDTH